MNQVPKDSATKGGVCIIAGEASGDAQAALLVDELLRLFDSKQEKPYFWGICGPLLRKAGVEAIVKSEDIAVMGIRAIIKNYLLISASYKKLLFEVERRKPRLIIVVDYPGFNLRFAEDVTRLGFEVVYYIPPKVWSHGLSRVEKLKKYTKLLVSILPFETEFFKKYGLNAVFVGNPLFDEVNRFLKKRALDPAVKPRDKYIIGILPGSRKAEVEQMLPLMIAAFVQLEKEFPNIVGKIPVAQTLTLSFMHTIFLKACQKLDLNPKKLSQKISFLEEHTYHVMHESHYAWVCSGTATLETAFFKTPLCAVYKLSPIKAFFARILLQVKYVSLVNLCMNKEVIPEFLESATVKNLVFHAKTMLTDRIKREKMISELDILRKLFPENAAFHAAQVIRPFILNNIRYGG